MVSDISFIVWSKFDLLFYVANKNELQQIVGLNVVRAV